MPQIGQMTDLVMLKKMRAAAAAHYKRIDDRCKDLAEKGYMPSSAMLDKMADLMVDHITVNMRIGELESANS